MDVVGVGEVCAGVGRSSVLHMGSGQGKERKLAIVEDRPEDTPVGRVASVAVVGVVDQEDISRVEVVLEIVQDVPDRKLAPNVLGREAHGDGHGISSRIPDPDRDVVHLGDEVELGGPVNEVPHLATDALHSMPDRG